MPRKKTSATLVYGIHSVRHALAASPEAALELWLQAGARNAALSELLARAQQQGLAVQEVPRGTLDRLVQGAKHQGAVLRRRAARALDESALSSVLDSRGTVPLLLVLDGVQDPHNLGACLRTADAAGVHALILPLHRAVGITGAVSKVASGAAESVPVIQVRNLARALREIRESGVCVVGTAEDAERSLYELDLRGPTALVLGGEERGLRRLSREHCEVLARIPMYGTVESLNLSVAAGICLYEVLRQRLEGSCQIAPPAPMA